MRECESGTGARAAFVAHALEAAEPERGSSQAAQQQAVRAMGKARAVQAAVAAQAAEAAEARGGRAKHHDAAAGSRRQREH